ncbi:MAG: OmpA family protein [Epsilonproteobacteria bacterium]|nr:OmpA family protein [Campylobacterota bacterium]
MGKKCPECDCPKCLPGWLAAFGDLMSLLLTFFVLLLSMSSMDAKKIQEAVGSLAGALSVLEGGTRMEMSREKVELTTTQEMKVNRDQINKSSSMKQLGQVVSEVNEMLKTSGSPNIVFEEAEKGFLLRLPSSLLFKPGEAKITNDDAILFLKRVALIIQKLPRNIIINAIGYTDNTPPPPNSPYKDNWELSTARGVAVVKELIKDGVDPKRLISSGKAQFDPVASNATPEGRAKNRRVELYFFSNGEKGENRAKKSILDMKKNK